MSRPFQALAALATIGLPFTASAQVLFTDSARVCPWTGPNAGPTTIAGGTCTPACSGSMVTNCYNTQAPPPPSSFRPLSAEPPTTTTRLWMGYQTASPGATQVLPHSRTTTDGRLVLDRGHGQAQYHPILRIFRPEALDHDLRIRGAASPGGPPAVSPAGPEAVLHPVMYQNPLDTNLVFAGTEWPPHTGKFVHHTLCDASTQAWDDGGRGRNPIACQAPRTVADEAHGALTNGDCYQVSVLAFGTPAWDLHASWDIRSVDLTVFVPHPKFDGQGLSDPDAQQPWIYPRQDLSASIVLPAHEPFLDFLGPETPGLDYPQYLQSQCLDDPSPPAFCDFLAAQHRAGPLQLHHASWTETWDMTSGHVYQIFEPTVTADGRLLVVNLFGFGVAYSYNAGDPCNAEGWTHFKHISEMPCDPDVATRYPIARGQVTSALPADVEACTGRRLFRDTKGRELARGAPLEGAYPWIDREGRNLFFTLKDPRDGYHAEAQSTAGPDPAKHLNPDIDPGAGTTVVGAWTQGKMVVLDNGLNAFDFGNHPGGADFRMALYQDDPATSADEGQLWIRPRPNREMASLENQLAYLDALSPVMPFDVVWSMSADVGRNAEVVFDDYLRNDALIVAHMNAPLEEYTGANGSKHWVFDDGFVATDPNADVRFESDPYKRAGFYFKRSPLLQNAATSDTFFDPAAVAPPSTLVLRGGARVEPLGQGGVLGKGVYLDGENDYIVAPYFEAAEGDWFLGVWLDSREDDPGLLRTVFRFGDGSLIRMSRAAIELTNNRIFNPSRVKTVDISALGLQKGRYYHLGVRVTTEGSERVLRFTVDGTAFAGSEVRYPVMSQSVNAQGFTLQASLQSPTQATLQVGIAPSNVLPWKGWVDELRVYRIDAGDGPGSYFDEVICNLALGTLVEVRTAAEEGMFPALGQLYQTAHDRGLVTTPLGAISPSSPAETALVCEQMRLHGTYAEPLDFPPQGRDRVCIDRVHRNPHQGADAALSTRCARRPALGLTPAHALRWDEPRPDFTQVDFCTVCHAPTARLPALRLDALTPGNVDRQADPRRQPMDAPARLFGRVPTTDGVTPTWPYSGPLAPPNGLRLDELIDLSGKISD